MLRAIAVTAVVVYHAWPDRLPGGYVGVDVFFVVSGYLITAHLVRNPPRCPRGLLAFWARRIRRLLPAAALVLATTAVAAVVLLPSNLLKRTAGDILASTFWAENWHLAGQATNYLQADDTPTAVQHYWSLGVEEQFYLVHPVLIGLSAVVAGRAATARASLRTVAGGLVAVATGGSLWWSIAATAADPARAYFVTTTRAWEFGLGALAAIAGVEIARRHPVRAAIAWLGVGVIVASTITYDAATPFPGIAAILPTAGALLVIVSASDDVRCGVGRVLGVRPIVGLGDISYGVYLWHWPLLLLAPFAVGALLDTTAKVVVVGATLALAAASKAWVEDPIRRSRPLVRSIPRSFAVGAVAVAGCALVTVGAANVAASRSASEQEVLQAARAGEIRCLGAAALRDSACGDPAGERLIVAPAAAATDRSVTYADGCWNNAPFTGRRRCTYGGAGGSGGSGTQIALLGNSHAGHWQPALVGPTGAASWTVTTYLASECYPVDIPLEMSATADSAGCAAWTQWAVGQVLAQHPDLVVLSARTARPLAGIPAPLQRAVQQAAYGRLLDRFTAAGLRVLVIRDTPEAGEPAPECIARERGNWRTCELPADVAIEPDPLAAAAQADASDLVSVADFNDTICWDGRCRDVVGGAIVYFDHGHLTRTFASSLRPEVTAAVQAALDT